MEEIPLKYCLYARKSTEGDEKQALSIDSQIKEMLQIAEREHLNITEIRKESHSAKASGTRPVFNEILEDIDKGLFNAIITWAPDRLSRNAGDLGQLVDRIDQKKLLGIKTFGQTFTDSPSDKFLLMILCSQAKLENDNKSINVKRGLRTRCEMGLRPAVPPTGYISKDSKTAKCEVEPDPKRAPVIKQIFENIAYKGWSVRKTHSWLKYSIDFKTKNDKHLSIGNMFTLVRNTFYYGRFEYPRGSGNWYDGIHTPIITKELFDLVSDSIKKHTMKTYGKEFAFTKFIKCAYCDSGVVADEKFKKLKSGGVNRHVYYRCCRSKDTKCMNKAINEKDLIHEFCMLADTLDITKLNLNERVTNEIKKFKQLQSMFLGIKKTSNIDDIDIRNYIKFILEQGSMSDKRSLLNCFTNEIFLRNKKIIIF
ncbi:hypothetical protein CL684_02345 [Candidatus Campbellbacteria bacterium]|nr:hypothetical protein [Candidatus Campbellbacteria bacterium]|tara:strand:- start:1528 stop:2799 length:1272 start_codon:yes stop_codon:yes gene_type:complete